jgi:serine/threonine-protein kinase RsbW
VSIESGLNEAHLIVRHGPLAGPVLGRVVGMLAARADCPIDRLEDALLIADAVADRAGSYSADGLIGVLVTAQTGAVELSIGPLREHGAGLCCHGAERLIASAELPGVGNVLERVADELLPERSNSDGEYLRIRMAFGPTGHASTSTGGMNAT